MMSAARHAKAAKRYPTFEALEVPRMNVANYLKRFDAAALDERKRARLAGELNKPIKRRSKSKFSRADEMRIDAKHKPPPAKELPPMSEKATALFEKHRQLEVDDNVTFAKKTIAFQKWLDCWNRRDQL